MSINRVYRIDVDLKGTIEILAADETEAAFEAEQVIRSAQQTAAVAGLYLRDPEVKPRLVLEKGEGT